MSDDSTFTSDAAGITEAVAEARETGLLPLPPETLEVKVIDEGILPMRQDEFGQEKGIDARKAASELRKFHESLATERTKFEAAADLDADWNREQVVAEALNNAATDDLYAVISSEEVPAEAKITASMKISERLAEREVEINSMADQLIQGTTQQLQRGHIVEQQAVALAQQMALSGLLHRHGFTSWQELQSWQQTAPDRYNAVIVEAGRIDQHLAAVKQDLARRIATNQQMAAMGQAQSFASFAEASDSYFSEANPDANSELALEYLTGALGLTVEQVFHLWHANPLFRSAAGQQAMYDAACWHKARQGLEAGRQKEPPLRPVVRPGSADARVSVEQADVSMAEEAMRSNPSVRNAARLSSARRATQR